MKRLKKSLAFIVSISMLATFSACNSNNKDSSKEETTTEATTEAVTEETTEIPTEKSVELSKTVTFENISYNIDKTWELQNKDEYDLITLKDFSGICIMSSKPKSGDSIPLSDSHVLTMVEMLIEDGQENENYEFDKIDNRNAVSATRKDDNYPEYFFTDGTDIYSITFLGDKNSDAQKYKEDFLKQIKIGVGESTELSETQKTIIDILQSGFESSFGENMKVYYEEDKSNYVISIWQDGVAANLATEAAADAWSTMIDTLVSAVGQMTDPIRQIDSTANITLNILSDENQKDIFLTIYNGEVSYNILDSETKPKEKTSEKSNKTVEHRTGDEIIGISDKSITDDDIYVLFEDSVRNDTTGKWRLARFSESIDISEYALSYYKEYFKSDDEIHAVINFATKTTTNISCMNGLLFVTTYEYVDKEEHDANKLFSGQMLSSYIIYLDNGDIEKI